MVWLKPQSSVNGSIWVLVQRQHGVVSRGQLFDLGLSVRAIEHRLATERLRSVRRGVYVVGRPELTQHGHWMAAILACGDGAVLSHRSAAALWDFGSQAGQPIHVSVPASSSGNPPGLRVHRRRALRSEDLDVLAGIPVTRPVRTLLDLAAELSDPRLERTVNEVDRLDLINPEYLREAIDAYRGEPGVARLRTLLDRRTFRLTDSELERYFLPLVDAVGLPRPDTKRWVNGFEVDFYWSELGLVVETDGLRYHRTPAQQARDRLRDQAHTAAGMTTLRFTHEQVRFEARYVRETLRAVATRLEEGWTD
jgi:very-short-patch-repair endonuclease